MEPLSESLLREALAGDAHAWRSLAEQLSPIIQRRVALGLMRRRARGGGMPTPAEVADLTQQVFVVLLDRAVGAAADRLVMRMS